MGTVIRLKNVSIGSSPLGMVHDVNYSIESGKLLFQPKTNLAGSQDILGNAILSEVGIPVYAAGYVQGTGTTAYLKSNFVRDTTKSFTLCVVAKRDATTGLQFFAGDYHNNTAPSQGWDAGAGIFASGTYGFRPTLFLASGGNLFSNNIPSALNSISVGEWHFACLTVDTVSKIAKFHVPEIGLVWQLNYTGELKALAASEFFTIGGNTGGASGDPAFVSFASFHERVFSADDVNRQYQNAKQYCATKGITVK
ncbi:MULTISPECIES: hypothetical protein [Acinetobacter]|uniref:hypothetical protein n=1 Tax=Acinetobacter TaxID=469 RepID=UPI000D002F88|nr:hypothetical protein [Acinetobacter sp. MYb10]QLD61372.1 hypothetical protein CQZ96_008860 [Acinetobacter sp. MYb10]